MSTCLDKLPECREIKDILNHIIHPDGTIYKVTEVCQQENSSGYKYIKPRVKGEFIFKFVHRAVAETFLTTDNHLPVVHHKDNNRKNNNLCNLMWTTQRINSQINYTQHTIVTHVNYGDQVVRNIREFAELWNIDSSSLSKMINGKFKQTSGWRLKNG